MKNFISQGVSLSLVAPADGVVSGLPLIIGAAFVVPKVTAVEGAVFSALRTGVFKLPKKPGDSPAQCAKAYWDTTNSRVTTTATGNKLVGIFETAGIADQTDINVLLTGEIV